jgi:Rad3-related DNA helicase
MSIIKQFPLEKARSTQVAVLNAIEKAFKDGYKNILLEAPVGSGKSAIAVACAKHFGESHIITPRKSLQDQYMDDFGAESLVMMKGRGSYPCTYGVPQKEYNVVIQKIFKGGSVQPKAGEDSCAIGPCIASRDVLEECSGKGGRECPYHVAIQTAQDSAGIIHNLHSFIFQAFFAKRFIKRPLLIIDECHEIESTIRSFSERKIRLPCNVTDESLKETERFKTLEDWTLWFYKYTHLFTDKNGTVGKASDKAVFLNTVKTLETLSDKFGEQFVPNIVKEVQYNRTSFTFTPERVGDLVNLFLLNFGDKRLLMSGTIYNKSQYCRNNGLIEDETCFIRTGSTFPKDTRPIYLKKDYFVDTSHSEWDGNFSEMVEKIETLFDVFDDVKGLIHTPSYAASQQIYDALKHTGRMVMHTKDDLQEKLQSFYAETEPKVFLSPVCQQGVDFKYDRARFQLILRVPYANTTDSFNAYKVKNDFQWYNYQALVIFGQQIGRINRAEDDFGVTILMDERFGKFISRNRNTLPKWLTDSIIYK